MKSIETTAILVCKQITSNSFENKNTNYVQTNNQC